MTKNSAGVSCGFAFPAESLAICEHQIPALHVSDDLNIAGLTLQGYGLC